MAPTPPAGDPPAPMAGDPPPPMADGPLAPMADAPLALLVSGPPASGKSTLGRALARHLTACLLDLDVVAGPLTETVARLLGTPDLDAPEMTGRVRAVRYECLLATAVDNLRVGTPVVLVAPFTAERTRPERWSAVRDRLAEVGGRPRLVWLRLSGDELMRRLRARCADRDAAKLADPAAFLSRHPLSPPVVEHIAVDADRDIRTQLAGVLAATS
jgi:predicted kinase